MELVAALAMGIGLGAITGMPLGVINVAIVDATIANETKHARGLGLGGAIADTAHSLLAYVGLARIIAARPALERTLAIVAASAIVLFAITSWRRRRADVKAPTAPSFSRGLVSGIALTLFNPGALAAWVAVAAMTWPGATTPIATAVGTGVGIGSAVWFTLLGWLVAKIPANHRALQIVPRVALALLVAIAIAAGVRAF